MTTEGSSRLVNKQKTTLQLKRGEAVVTYIESSVAYLAISREVLGHVVVPGTSRTAHTIDILIAKSYDAMLENLDLLGSRWLLDSYQLDSNNCITEIIDTSVVMRSWEKNNIWLGVPLGKSDKSNYLMPMHNPLSELSPWALLNCASSIILDQYAGIAENALSSCTNSLAHLAGDCFLGCALCSISLGKNATAEH